MDDIIALVDTLHHAMSIKMSLDDTTAFIIAELERIVTAPEFDVNNLVEIE